MTFLLTLSIYLYIRVGWDPVTGLGSINFPALATMFNVSAPYTKGDTRQSTSLTLQDLLNSSLFGLSSVYTDLILAILLAITLIILTFITLTLYRCYCQRSHYKVRPLSMAVITTHAIKSKPTPIIHTQDSKPGPGSGPGFISYSRKKHKKPSAVAVWPIDGTMLDNHGMHKSSSGLAEEP